MKSKRSKLLHTVSGRPMLAFAVDSANALEPQRLVVVVGHLREQVEAMLVEYAPQALIVEQPVRNGTGGAVACGLAEVPAGPGEIVVTYGDVPMLTGETLNQMVAVHRTAGNACTILTAHVADPTGYGRIVRDGELVARIVEHKDASEEERAITEINSGIYVFDAEVLRDGVETLQPNNAQGELYLTDVVAHARALGRRVGAHVTTDFWQTEGVNDRLQLSKMNAEANRRILERWMLDGVTIADPHTTWIEADVDLAEDVTILPNTQLLGATSIATGAIVGPDTTLRDVEVGENAHVIRTHAELSEIGPDASVGPYSRLRPGTVLGAGGKIGSFVETKNAQIGAGSKLPHLTYCGDAYLGEGVNVGAGTIFANYDGDHRPAHPLGRPRVHRLQLGAGGAAGHRGRRLHGGWLRRGGRRAGRCAGPWPAAASTFPRAGWPSVARASWPNRPPTVRSRSIRRSPRRTRPVAGRSRGECAVSGVEASDREAPDAVHRSCESGAGRGGGADGVEMTPSRLINATRTPRSTSATKSVRGSDAFVIQSHPAPVNEWLMEQLIMVDALKRASAKRITVVAPCYPARPGQEAHGTRADLGSADRRPVPGPRVPTAL